MKPLFQPFRISTINIYNYTEFGVNQYLGGMYMIKNIPWQFETLPQTPFNTIEDILDDKGNPVGSIELTTKGFTQLKEKRRLIGRKEAFVKQTNIIFRNQDGTISVKTICNNRMNSLAYNETERVIEYEKNGNVNTIKLVYHNESVKYYYEFDLNGEIYQAFFDDDGVTFEIQKDKSLIASYEQVSHSNHTYEVEAAYEEDVWLWLSLFVHLHYHFPRNRGIIFRG